MEAAQRTGVVPACREPDPPCASAVMGCRCTMPAAAIRNNALAGHAAMTLKVMAALPSLA